MGSRALAKEVTYCTYSFLYLHVQARVEVRSYANRQHNDRQSKTANSELAQSLPFFAFFPLSLGHSGIFLYTQFMKADG